MIAVVSVAAGAAAYLWVLAMVSFFYGEAPGELKRVMAHLRGEPAPKRTFLRWASIGTLDRTQRFALVLIAALVLGGTGLLVFHSWGIAVVLSLGAPLYPRSVERTISRQRKAILLSQFGMSLQVMAASLRSGASLKSAVERACQDLDRMLAGQAQKPMVEELDQIARDMRSGGSLEEALIRFRDRVQMEDATDFVNAVLLCRVRGGNTAIVMASIAEIIQDKITVSNQIMTLTAGKRMEANLITFAPPLLVAFLGFASPGYLKPFYETPTGFVLLFVGCGCLAASYVIGRRVLDIQV